MKTFIKCVATAVAVTVLILSQTSEATAQRSAAHDDLARRIDRLERNVERIIEVQERLAESVAALQESRGSQFVSYEYESDDALTTEPNQITVRATGNSHARIELANGGFLEVRGTEAGPQDFAPSSAAETVAGAAPEVTFVSRGRYHETPEPVFASGCGSRPFRYAAARRRNGSPVLVRFVRR